MDEKNKSQMIDEILEIELVMFLSVRARQKASCQEQPDTFRMMRKAQFSAWSGKTLACYLDDLRTAQNDGTNLMTHKYARMDNTIPRLNEDPLIEKIVRAQYAWQQTLMEKYPYLMHRARPLKSSEDTYHQTSFETYLTSELETYSHKTLESLYEDIEKKQQEGKNLTKEVYEYILKELGHESLAAADAFARKGLRFS